VRLTGDQSVSIRNFSLPSGNLKVSFETGAMATLEQLRFALRKNRAVLRTMIPEIQGTGIDQRTGEVVIYILGPKAEGAAFIEQETEIERVLGVPVRIQVEQVKERNVARLTGGAKFFSQNQQCTTGFNVYSDPVYAVVTAAHCPNIASTYQNWQSPTSASYVFAQLEDALVEWHDGSRDFQIHPVHPSSGNYVTEAFYGISADVISGITSVISQADTAIGTNVCHRGVGSGYSCGKVADVDYDPDTCPGSCENNWVLVQGPDLACASGDSGGPVFRFSSAYGIAKSALSSGPGPGQCIRMTYMPLDRLAESGVSILR